MYTIVEANYLIYDSKLKENIIKKELQFYNGNLTDVDLSTDTRFKAVKNKRNKSIILGLKDDLKFPIKYPFTCDDNGFIVKDIYSKNIIDEE